MAGGKHSVRTLIERWPVYRQVAGADPLGRGALDTAMDMIADRVISARRQGWEWDVDGIRTRRTLGLATLGGASMAKPGTAPTRYERPHPEDRCPASRSGTTATAPEAATENWSNSAGS